MCADLPIRDPNHVTAEQGIAALRCVLPKEWIVRVQDSDYGIDVEIEIATTHVTGRIFKGQVKAHRRIAWGQDKTFLQPVRPSTLAYWRAMRVPVVVFCADLDSGRVVWSPGTGRCAESRGVRLRKGRRLPKTLQTLRAYLARWMDADTSMRHILAVPRIAEQLRRRRHQMEYDSWMALRDEQLQELATLYSDVVSLRQALGLSFSDILPWSLWLARARRVFGSNAEEMYWGIHDEVLLYLGPLADEAILRAKERLRLERPTPDNLYAKRFADDIRWMIRTGFDEADDSFWSSVEEILERRGALVIKRAKRPR